MFVTRHHAKHVLNYEYLTAARILHSALGFQHFPRDLANVNEWKIMFDPPIKVSHRLTTCNISQTVSLKHTQPTSKSAYRTGILRVTSLEN